MKEFELPSADLFIQKAKGADAIAQLTHLLGCLENRDSRANACRVLHELAISVESDPSGALMLQSTHVPGLAEPIRLILHSAVFSPEFWGRTFAEGLLKDTEPFRGKRVVELGTGSGWISLLLLQRTGVRDVLGLDINPIAIVIANINKWLNGTYPDGTLRLSQAGIPIVEAFRAEVSDLLKQPLDREEKFDHVIGCIPQVLHPDPGKISAPADSLSHRDLYDLSNYCFNQGILEDRFGLPLIARAIEEAQLCLNPQGFLTLILGGRPGQIAIEEMFRRRGYSPELWWVRRIQQADDTDLAQLVNLENLYGIKFHFFVSNSSKYSIPASTAVELQKKGQKIFHDLLVYQARTQYEKPTFGFVHNLHALGLDELRKELDFSRISEEQISFLERVTLDLLNRKTVPYPHERGDFSFREKLAKFLSIYCYYSTSAQRLFVGPDRAQMLSMVLSIALKQGEKVLLSASLENLYAETLTGDDSNIILGNDDLFDILKLDALFGPKIVLLSPYQLADPSPLLVQELIEHARAYPERWYIIDDSKNFDIGSASHVNMLVRLIGQQELPPNLIFLYGLIKNTVCPDFELSFLINLPERWIQRLEVCAELSYSRISYIIQLYYDWLFDELLSFPFAIAEPETSMESKNVESLPLSGDWLQEIVEDPVFAPKSICPESADVVRFDYGELEYPVPDLLVKGLIKGFLEMPAVEISEIVNSRVSAYLRKTRETGVEVSRLVLAQGVFPLFGALIQSFAKRLGRAPVIALPRASYGPLYPMLKYHGAEIELIDGVAEQAFMINASQLSRLSRKPDILWLTQPSNPSGIYFEPEDIRNILRTCAELGIYVFADEIFFLLSDPALGAWTPPVLSFGFAGGGKEGRWLFYADGLSKAFAAGGLRCGFMVCPDASWAEEIRRACPLPPQSILRAWDNLYSVFLEQSPHQMIDVHKERKELEQYLFESRTILAEQRTRIIELLSEYGLSDLFKDVKRGGIFVIGRLAEHVDILASEEKLLLNSAAWGRMEPWARLCFGLESAKFEEGYARLKRYLQSHCQVVSAKH